MLRMLRRFKTGVTGRFRNVARCRISCTARVPTPDFDSVKAFPRQRWITRVIGFYGEAIKYNAPFGKAICTRRALCTVDYPCSCTGVMPYTVGYACSCTDVMPYTVGYKCSCTSLVPYSA